MSTTRTSRPRAELQVPFEEHELANGLHLILHEDHASPVVAVYLCYHVGSAREELGRSGFAHLFEHMLFQGSQHVAADGHFRRISEAGGTLNGQTSFDRTLYFETLPANHLELALWLEADRMGFLLPAMTQAKLDNQREVVRNERRQNYENRPYGEASGAVHAALFPAGHPYHSIPIGSHADLEAATLEDLERFFRSWYGPNDATLAIGGDFEPRVARALVEQYFGPIPRGPAIPPVPRRPARLAETCRIELRDRVQLPRIVFTWPAPALGEDDETAVDLATMILSENRASVFDRALTIDELLAREVFISNNPGEVAGRLSVTVTAAPGVELATIEARLCELLAGVARDGVDPDQLARMKTRLRSRSIQALETVSGRTRALAESRAMTGDPAYFLERLRRLQQVTAEEVHAALLRYVIDRPAVLLSILPGEKHRAPEEPVPAPARPPLPPRAAIADAFDRSRPPGAAPRSPFAPPPVWTRDLARAAAIGTTLPGVPLTRLLVGVPAGRIRESGDRAGLSLLCAEWMNEGTRRLSTTAFSDAQDALGADLRLLSGEQEIQVALTVLDEHRDDAVELLRDVLLEPRFDGADFTRIREQRLQAIDARQDRITAVADDAWRRLLFGPEDPLGRPLGGRRESVAALEPHDAAEFHRTALARGGARICVVGDLDGDATAAALAPVVRGLGDSDADRTSPDASEELPARGAGRIHLIDRPGAAQSELRIGHLSVSSLDPDFYPLAVLNFVLGGTFTSRVNLNLREEKGYTYGARTGFAGGLRCGPFTATASVHTQFTAESVHELLDELQRIRRGIRPEELEFARRSLTQAMLRRFESSSERLRLVNGISLFGRPTDWPKVCLDRLETLTTAELDDLARRYVRPDDLAVLVVGDAERVRPGLEALGRGPVVELDGHGEPF